MSWWYDLWRFVFEEPLKFGLIFWGIILGIIVLYVLIFNLIKYLHNRRVMRSQIWYTNGKELYQKKRY